MKLAVFDIDGVIYDGHTFFDIIKNQERDMFIPLGTWGKIEQELKEYKAGHKSYTEAANTMLDVYVKSLTGITYKKQKDFIFQFINNKQSKFYSYLLDIFPKLKKTHDIYLLTTNLKCTAETITEYFNLKGFICSEEEIIYSKYTGQILHSIAGNKHRIESLIDKYSFEGSIAVGDSINDIPMLEKVEHPFCMNPDEKLMAHAKKNSWRIVNQNNIKSSLSEIL